MGRLPGAWAEAGGSADETADGLAVGPAVLAGGVGPGGTLVDVDGLAAADAVGVVVPVLEAVDAPADARIWEALAAKRCGGSCGTGDGTTA